MVKPKRDPRNKDYECPVRNMPLSIDDNSGERCYTGGEDNICNITGELCTIYQLDARAKSGKIFIDRHMSELSDEELLRISEEGPIKRMMKNIGQEHELIIDGRMPSRLKWLQ